MARRTGSRVACASDFTTGCRTADHGPRASAAASAASAFASADDCVICIDL